MESRDIKLSRLDLLPNYREMCETANPITETNYSVTNFVVLKSSNSVVMALFMQYSLGYRVVPGSRYYPLTEKIELNVPKNRDIHV